jgi:hypothetical protein
MSSAPMTSVNTQWFSLIKSLQVCVGFCAEQPVFLHRAEPTTLARTNLLLQQGIKLFGTDLCPSTSFSEAKPLVITDPIYK